MALIAVFSGSGVSGGIRHLRSLARLAAVIPVLIVLSACGLDQQITQALDPQTDSINPVAVIDAPSTGTVRTYLTIDGINSYSHRNGSLTYAWTLTEKPRCSSAGFGTTVSSTDTTNTVPTTTCVENATLTATTSGVTLLADKGGYYTVTLSVAETVSATASGVTTTTTGTSQLVSARINVVGNGSNHPPVAVAKTTFKATSVASLDATESYDVDGQRLTYSWSVMSATSADTGTTNAEITSSTSSVAYLYNWIGSTQTYLVKLHVSDGVDYDEAVLQVTTD